MTLTVNGMKRVLRALALLALPFAATALLIAVCMFVSPVWAIIVAGVLVALTIGLIAYLAFRWK